MLVMLIVDVKGFLALDTDTVQACLREQVLNHGPVLSILDAHQRGEDLTTVTSKLPK